MSSITVAAPVAGRSLWNEAWRRLRRNRAAMGGLWFLAVVALLALLAPLLSPFDYTMPDYDFVSAPPSLASGHWLGTDDVGRDLWVRILYSARISLAVGLVATAVSLVIGVAYGAVAGYVGGAVDSAMMRLIEILYSIPFIFMVILLMVMFGRNVLLIFIAIGAVEWLDMARIVRGQALSLKRREFVEAARAVGVGGWTMVRRHIIPNTLGPVVVYATLTVPRVILIESFLSFLGLGVQEPQTSWGVLISDGAQVMETQPWMLVFPALFLAGTLFAFNFLGDGLRDALDPRDR
jgi:oligopeptide transport system permease protein